MDSSLPLFKRWVPEWLVKVILFAVLLPSIVLFFLPLSNINVAAGYYGSESADMQFAVALFYAGYVGFYCLERRFFLYLATKEYFIIFTFLQIVTTLICYCTQDLYILFPVRFIQGMLFSSTVNLSLSLIFTRLRSERAKEIGFSVFFGMLLCAIPFNNLVTADIIDSYNFNIVYKCAIFSYIPGFFMLLISMNDVRLNVKFHLYQLDWESFAMYSIILSLIGYITIFGQEYYWLEDLRIRCSSITIAVLVMVYTIRQMVMKRPYMNLAIFRSRNYIVGILLLFVMYICRFASGITNTFFSSVLRFDPMHVSYINAINIGGLVTGVIVSCAMILQKIKVRYIWLSGFASLFVFHIVMFFLFDTQADADYFFIPLFIQGLGVGVIMVPSIVYAISAVPVAMSSSAAAICLTIRYLGFCVSIAIINYYELYEKSRHYNAFQDSLTSLNPVAKQRLAQQAHLLMSKGLHQNQSMKGAYKLMINAVNGQSQMRFAMDYYEMMAWVLLFTLLLISLFPYLNRTIVNIQSRNISPA